MADFLKAWLKTSTYEGGYSNVEGDKGGETYKGISSTNNPYWSGWTVIDKSRQHPDFPKNLESNEELLYLVLSFYRFIWDSLSLDKLKSQFLAEVLFDTSVNMGKGRAVQFLQQSMNALNRNGTLWGDVDVDRGYGGKTHNQLSLVSDEDLELIAKCILILRGAFFIEITLKDESQEKFIRGWLKRVEFKL